MTNSQNLMRDQIMMTGAALKNGFADLESRARLILPTPEIYRARRIVLVGSGDSHFAAKAAEAAFIAHSGLPVEVRTPLDAGRYHARMSAPRDMEHTLVIAISSSGEAARVCEAAGLYRSAGANVLALTKSETGRLAGIASRALIVPVPAMPSAPGVGSYLFTMLALFLVAIRIGEVRLSMTMDEAQTLREAILSHLGDIDQIAQGMDAPARGVAQRLSSRSLTEFLGAGPNTGVAEFGAAKTLEASGRHALARDLEEWTHLNYFDGTPENIATVLCVPKGSVAEERASELLVYMRKLGRVVIVVGALADNQDEDILSIETNIPEIWSPLLLSIPIALIAAHQAEIDGAEYGRGGTGRWEDSADAGTVQKSRIWEPGA